MPSVQRNKDVLVAVATTFMIIGTFMVMLRLYVRKFLLKALGFDDTLIIIAWFCFMVQAIFVVVGVGQGLGNHIAMLSIPQRVSAIKCTIMWELFYLACDTFIKASIGASLLRLTMDRAYVYILCTGMFCDFGMGIATFTYIVFTCSPIDYQWTAFDPTTPPGHCVKPEGLKIIGNVFLAMTCIVYFLFAVLPIFMLWNVRIKMKVKISVMIVLSLGLVAMIATLVRLHYLPGALKGSDLTFNITDALIWALIECGTGMTAACIATFRPLFRFLVEGSPALDGFQHHVGLEDVFEPNFKTTIQANSAATHSREEIMGNGIVQTIEVTVDSQQKSLSGKTSTSTLEPLHTVEE